MSYFIYFFLLLGESKDDGEQLKGNAVHDKSLTSSLDETEDMGDITSCEILAFGQDGSEHEFQQPEEDHSPALESLSLAVTPTTLRMILSTLHFKLCHFI